MCADISFIAAAWIRGKMVELDSIPRNFGKAVRDIGREWREQSGVKIPPPVACPRCDAETPGFFTVWRPGGFRSLAKCQCNKQPQFAAWQARSEFELAQLGYIVRPYRYPGTWRNFELEHFPDTNEGEPSEFGAIAAFLAANPRWDDRKRKDHQRQLLLAEIGSD
jgi:hypothetical protein